MWRRERGGLASGLAATWPAVEAGAVLEVEEGGREVEGASEVEAALLSEELGAGTPEMSPRDRLSTPCVSSSTRRVLGWAMLVSGGGSTIPKLAAFEPSTSFFHHHSSVIEGLRRENASGAADIPLLLSA